MQESDMEAIIQKAQVCRLGLSDGRQPYVIPLCFGYQDKTLFFHGSGEGKKINIIKQNPLVCVEFDVNVEFIKSEEACKWDVKYQSVIGYGKASIIEDYDQKRQALKIMMSQYSEKDFIFSEKTIQNTFMIKVELEQMTGKQNGYA